MRVGITSLLFQCVCVQIILMKDQACISVDETRARHHFTGCGGENGTSIKLVTNEEVGQLRNLLITTQSRNKKKLALNLCFKLDIHIFGHYKTINNKVDL